MFENKEKKQIETQINELQLYLENNYKDLAIAVRKDAVALIEGYYKQGKINDKTYLKYNKILSEYTNQMKEYNHQQFYKS